VVVLAFALTRFLELPTRSLVTTFFGSPLGFELNGQVLMMVLAAALVSAGSDTIIRSHPRLREQPNRRTVVHWVMPGIAALELAALLNQAPDGPFWWLGLGLSAIGLLLVLVAEYISVDRTDPNWDLAALGLTALAYALALALFALLRSWSARAIVVAPVGGLAAAALALRMLMLRAAPVPRGQFLLYSAVVGVVAGEALWALNYWRVAPSSAGLFAMIPFYLGVGLAQQHLAGQLTVRVWAEYLVVGALGLAIALTYALV